MIDYKIRRFKRSKHLRITVKQNGECLVSAPLWVSKNQVDRFVQSKELWVQKSLDSIKAKSGLDIQTKEQRRLEYLSLKEKARNLVLERIDFFNQYYNFRYNKISIRVATTRWGSCSSKRNLNFNFKVVFLPMELLDYVVVHELCHLGELNHSKDFWDLVRRTIPDLKTRLLKLKSHSL